MAKDKKALYSRFKIVGVPVVKDVKDMYTQKKSESGYNYRRLNIGIKTDDNNVLFVQMMGGYFNTSDIIKTFSKDKDSIEVAFSNRLNPTILNSVADWVKLKVGLSYSTDGAGKTIINQAGFLSAWDAIPAIVSGITENPNQPVVVTGNVKFQRYKNKEGVWKVSKSLDIQNIRFLYPNEKVNSPNSGEFTFLYDSKSWVEDLEENKKVYIDGFVSIREKGSKESVFVPQRFVLNCAKLDLTDSRCKEIFDFYKNIFMSVEDDTINKTTWHCNIVRGAEETEITMEDLNENQRTMIELGLADLESIKRDMGGLRGNTVDEIRLVRPKVDKEGNMFIPTPWTYEDFAKNNDDEEFNTVLAESMQEDKPKSNEELMDSIFGI